MGHAEGHAMRNTEQEYPAWRTLTPEQKMERLTALRRRQQAQVAIDIRRLRVAR